MSNSCSFGLLVLLASCVLASSFVVRDNRIIDSEGREVLFHGVNVIYKSAPYIPIIDRFDGILSFSVEDAKILNSLGLNVIRLGAQWPGVEPARGQYDELYVAQLVRIVDTCADYNITVFLDAHQVGRASLFRKPFQSIKRHWSGLLF